MNLICVALLTGFAGVGAHAQIATSKPMLATVTVKVGAEGTERVPATIFGSFLEPIGDSINNGVVAEILVNGSLEAGLWNHTNLENMFQSQPDLIESSNTTGIPLPWQALSRAAGNRYELHVGNAANSWQSLELLGQPHEQVGIMQQVYLPVQRVLRYTAEVKITDMTGIMEFAGIWKKREQVYAVPAYYVFKLYTSVAGDTVLPVSTDSGTYNVAGGVRPLDKVQEIPYIDVVATRSADGKKITLLCVNRSLNEDVPTSFDLGSLHMAGPAEAQQLSAGSRYERNDEVEPEHIVPEPITVTAARGRALSITLPHESVTVLHVRVQ